MTRHPRSARALRLLAAAAALALAGSAHAFDLTVEVLNAKPAQGFVYAAVFGTEASWLKNGQAVQGERAAAAEKTVIVYRNLPAGSYAVSMYQDENGNGKFDTNVSGLPIERFGFSRDARGRMGPPSFADAVFELKADTTVSVTLH